MLLWTGFQFEFITGAQALVAIIATALILIAAYLLFEAFETVGFTPWEATVIIFISPLAFVLLPTITVFMNGALGIGLGPFFLGIIQVADSDTIAIGFNVAGALIPVIISARVILDGRSPIGVSLPGIALVSVLAFVFSEPIQSVGILILDVKTTVIAASAYGAVMGVAIWRRHRCLHVGPLSYVAGVFGILIGADFLHLPEVLTWPGGTGQVASIGGAGVFDAIFIVGLLAVVLDATVYYVARQL